MVHHGVPAKFHPINGCCPTIAAGNGDSSRNCSFSSLSPSARSAPHQPAILPRDFHWARDLQAMPLLDGLSIIRRLDQTTIGARAEPGKASTKFTNLQFAPLEIHAAHVSDFKFAVNARLQPGGKFADLRVAKKPGTAEFVLGRCGFSSIEIALPVFSLNSTTPNCLGSRAQYAGTCAGHQLCQPLQQRREARIVTQFVAQNQTGRPARQKIAPDQERLRKTFRARLLSVMLILAWKQRGFFRQHPLALCGSVLLISYILLRAASFDHISETAGVNLEHHLWLAVMEIGGIICFIVASFRARVRI
jgi:hypothetical protein